MRSLFVILLIFFVSVSCVSQVRRIFPSESEAGYLIRPDDVLLISVRKEPDLTASLPVRPDGKISLPLRGDVQAAGLRPKQLANSITEELKKYIADPEVAVSIVSEGPPPHIQQDDVLRISVWKEPEISGTVPVRADGKISLPLVGELQAAGQTSRQLEDEITEKLKKYIADPRVAVSIETECLIGKNDVLTISVWKEPDLTAMVQVRPDGKISLPLRGDVQAAGLTPTQLANSITEKLKKYIADPRVAVSINQSSDAPVFTLFISNGGMDFMCWGSRDSLAQWAFTPEPKMPKDSCRCRCSMESTLRD